MRPSSLMWMKDFLFNSLSLRGLRRASAEIPKQSPTYKEIATPPSAARNDMIKEARMNIQTKCIFWKQGPLLARLLDASQAES